MNTFSILLLLFFVGFWLARWHRRAARDDAERAKHEAALEAMRPQTGPFDRDGLPIYAGWFYHPENQAERSHLIVTEDTEAFLRHCEAIVEQEKQQNR